MRQGFTLIELMIVIAIIAIIAAIAIPNLLESRITANESSAATSLKSGILPAQTMFQSSGFVDIDGNGRGCYASVVGALAGMTQAAVPADPNDFPLAGKACRGLDPVFANSGGGAHGVAAAQTPAAAPTAGTFTGVWTVGNASRSGAYDFALRASNTESEAETYWGIVAIPITTDGANGRRAFGLSTGGTLWQTKQSQLNATLTFANLLNTFTNAAPNAWQTDPSNSLPQLTTATVAPYQK